MNFIPRLVLAGVVGSLPLQSHAVEIVYNNLINPLGAYASALGYEEAADDVALGGTARIFDSLTVAYAGFDFDGDETLTVSLYRMNGAPTPGSFGYNTPGSVLFTATVPIGSTPGATLTFSDSTVGVLPNVLAVGFKFSGINAPADAGPLLFNPPSPGSSFYDFWLRGYPNAGDPWGLFMINNGDPPVNLGIQITATTVPEGGAWVTWCGLVTMASLGLLRQRGLIAEMVR